jgi:hypothetical protein
MKILTENETVIIAGGTSTNGTAGVAGVYNVINGLSNATDAAAQLAGDVGDFFRGVGAGIYDAL